MRSLPLFKSGSMLGGNLAAHPWTGMALNRLLDDAASYFGRSLVALLP